jgi:nitrate reductase assembly molybdenum cofactor insertion protein NarJ
VIAAATDVWDRLADALEYPQYAPPAVQERYVATFDLNPACALDVGWHLYGETPERGTFLSTLREALRRAGVDERGELPDHLPTLLRLIPREDEAFAGNLAARIAPVVERLRDMLGADGNPFADVIAAVARLLDARIPPDTRGQTPVIAVARASVDLGSDPRGREQTPDLPATSGPEPLGSDPGNPGCPGTGDLGVRPQEHTQSTLRRSDRD